MEEKPPNLQTEQKDKEDNPINAENHNNTANEINGTQTNSLNSAKSLPLSAVLTYEPSSNTSTSTNSETIIEIPSSALKSPTALRHFQRDTNNKPSSLFFRWYFSC